MIGHYRLWVLNIAPSAIVSCALAAAQKFGANWRQINCRGRCGHLPSSVADWQLCSNGAASALLNSRKKSVHMAEYPQRRSNRLVKLNRNQDFAYEGELEEVFSDDWGSGEESRRETWQRCMSSAHRSSDDLMLNQEGANQVEIHGNEDLNRAEAGFYSLSTSINCIANKVYSESGVEQILIQNRSQNYQTHQNNTASVQSQPADQVQVVNKLGDEDSEAKDSRKKSSTRYSWLDTDNYYLSASSAFYSASSEPENGVKMSGEDSDLAHSSKMNISGGAEIGGLLRMQ